jgi:hypothetical protein
MHTMRTNKSPMRRVFLSTLLLAVLVLFIPGQVYPQNDECLSRTSVVTIIGKRVTSAEHVKGPVHPTLLTPADLRAKAGGKDVAIESVTRPSAPLRIAVILDVGAGQSKSTWEITRFILHNFPSQFAQGTEFSLVTFDSQVEQKSSFSIGAHALDDALSTQSPSKTKESEAGLYGALARGIAAFGDNRPGDAEFLITAWEDGRNSDMSRAVARQLLQAGVRLFGVSFDSSRVEKGPPFSYVTLTPVTPIDTIARTSGGWWMRAALGDPRNNVIPEVFGESMSDFYNVSLKLAQPLTKAQELRIELVKNPNVSSQTNLSARDVLLSYPQTLYPCH